MTDARQDDEFGSLMRLASSRRKTGSFSTLSVSPTTTVVGTLMLPTKSRMSSVIPCSNQARFAASVPPKVSSVTCFRKFRRELPGGEDRKCDLNSRWAQIAVQGSFPLLFRNFHRGRRSRRD
jgi:hypothetical protein